MLASPGNHDAGYAEIASVALIWTVGCLVMVRKASVLGKLFAHQSDAKSFRRWLRFAWEYPVLSALHSLLIDATGYVQFRLALKWRGNVTFKLHSMYFRRMAYYRIQHESKDPSVTDPEVRICRDVRDMVQGTSELAVSLTEALVKTFIFGGITFVYRHWLWALSPPLFFLVAVKVIIRLEPAQGTHIHNTLQHIEGKFKRHLARLQAHAESVCMLQGEAFELDLLQKAMSDIGHLAKRRCDVMFFMETAEWMFFRSPQAAALIELVAHFCAACSGVGHAPAGAPPDAGGARETGRSSVGIPCDRAASGARGDEQQPQQRYLPYDDVLHPTPSGDDSRVLAEAGAKPRLVRGWQ